LTIEALARDLILFTGRPDVWPGVPVVNGICTAHRLLNLFFERMREIVTPQNPECLRRAHYPEFYDLPEIEETAVSGHDEVSSFVSF